MKKFLIVAIIFAGMASLVSCGSKENSETTKTEQTKTGEDEHEDEH
jgi:major membrane immunogen (membrane-anchored lipoprotein)